MHGLLADVNVQGHLPYLRRLMEGQGLLELLTEMGISLVTFPEIRLDRGALANKGKFENSETYAARVAQDVAELLVVAFVDEIRNQPRIFVPL